MSWPPNQGYNQGTATNQPPAVPPTALPRDKPEPKSGFFSKNFGGSGYQATYVNPQPGTQVPQGNHVQHLYAPGPSASSQSPYGPSSQQPAPPPLPGQYPQPPPQPPQAASRSLPSPQAPPLPASQARPNPFTPSSQTAPPPIPSSYANASAPPLPTQPQSSHPGGPPLPAATHTSPPNTYSQPIPPAPQPPPANSYPQPPPVANSYPQPPLPASSYPQPPPVASSYPQPPPVANSYPQPTPPMPAPYPQPAPQTPTPYSQPAPPPIPSSQPAPPPLPASSEVPKPPVAIPDQLYIPDVSVHALAQRQKMHIKRSPLHIIVTHNSISVQLSEIQCGPLSGPQPSFSSDPGCFVLRELAPPYRFIYFTLPHQCSQEEILIAILEKYSTYQRFERPKPEERSAEVQKASEKADKIKQGGEKTGKGVTTVATGIGSGIKAGGNFYTNHTSSGDSGEVDERTKQRIETTKKVGGTVATGTSKAIGGVSKGANWVGKQSKKGKPEKPKTEKEEARGEYVNGAMAGGGAVWRGVTDGARIIGRDVKDTTVTCVEHKHGESYAESTSEGFKAAGGVAVSAVNVSSLSTIWITAGINMAAGALSSEPAKKLMAGASWKEGYLSVCDDHLGWCNKYVALKSQALVFYSATRTSGGELIPSGILPLAIVGGVKPWDLGDPRWKKKPHTFTIETQDLDSWIISPDCSWSDELKSAVLGGPELKCDNPAAETADWCFCLNALSSVQNA